MITRPRRFGKTLTMSMIENFFSITHKKNTLFKMAKQRINQI
ncbi:MAG: AAA family ATPase [Coprococcus phoceensis]